MQKKETQLIITGILVFVLFMAIIRAVKRVRPSASRPGAFVAAPLKEEQSYKEGVSAEIKGEGNELFQKLEEETRSLEVSRDPFAPAAVAPTKTIQSGLHLTGIVWDQQHPKAIINEVIIDIGDNLDGNTVVEIKQDRVILYDGMQYFELRLGQSGSFLP